MFIGGERINRRSFLAEMRSLLAFMDADDRARVLRFYEKLFDQAGEEGEGALLKKLGSPVRQVLQVEKLYRDKEKAEELSGAAESVQEVIAAAELPAEEPAAPAEEEEAVPAGSDDPMGFDVPDEEDAVDFGAEEEPADVIPVQADEQPEETPESEEEMAREPAEEAFGETAEEAEAASAGEFSSELESDAEEGVTEVVAPPDEDLQAAVSDEPVETEETDEEEPEAEEAPKEPVGAGRIVAAVFVTIPVIVLVLLGFALALGLGFTAMGGGAVFGALGGYLSGYAFGGVTAFLPDILLLAGGMLLSFCLALFFLWLGLWLAVGGVRLTIRTVAAIYRGILKRGGQTNE